MATAINVSDFPFGLNLAASEQRCLHALTGRAPEHKSCANGYECGNCPFDQMLDDMNADTRPMAEIRPAKEIAA